MALSAAELQRRHALEGAPDPFPSLSEPGNQGPKQQEKRAPAAVDTQSEDAFPSLASATPGPPAQTQSAWGNGPRIKAPVVPKVPVFTESFNLAAMDLSNAGRDGKAASLGEVMKTVMAKYKVKIDASANQRTRQTTFHIKAESEKELDKAKRSLLALTSPVIKLTIHAPLSTIPSIIGTKGANLKRIRDQTSVRVDIKRDAPSAQANGDASSKASPIDEDEEEPTVPVELSGPQPLAYEAQEMLYQIIRERAANITSRVKDIPAHILPFVVTRRASFIAAAEGGYVNLALDQPAREITITGDREAVTRVAESIKTTIEFLKSVVTSLKMNLPKRQHRLLSGQAAEQVMAKAKCSVTVPPHNEAGDEVTVWGEAADLPQGLSAVMEQANSKYIHEFPLPGPISFSKELVAYISHVDYVKTLQSGNEEVEVYLPSTDSNQSSLSIDLIGDKSQTDVVVKKLSGLIGKLFGATRSLNIDWLLHRIIQGKNEKKIEGYHGSHNVLVYFPAESAETSSVLLVYDPFSPKASPAPDVKKKHLDHVEKELSKMAKDAADVKTVKIDVEKKWHEAVGGTTLNKIIGEDTTLSFKFGAEAGEGTEDVIVVRGLRPDVDRVVKEINQIVEDAKEDHILSSYFTEFEIDKEYVGRVVGSQGAGINRLRDQLHVKVDVSDEGDDKGASKKRGTTGQKSKITITGRKENAEEAKQRILAQVERIADETSETIKIPAQYHSSLIGQGGKYAIRLEEKYAVKITFPRSSSDSGEGRTREPLKADEVLLKGGKKGVAQAKSELLDALEFEKENNHSLSFTIPTRAVAKVLGRGGTTINEIKDNTGANIDVEKGYSDTTEITLKGTKQAITEAKAAILAISDQVGEETTETITIESKYHRAIIGAGGQGLRELIAKCDGPTDSKTQAGLIRFPRQGETGDEVRLRGEPKLVAKLKAELESLAASFRDRVIFGVEVPAAQHRALIGRGGAHLNEVQDKFSVQIQIPGSRSYGQIGEPQNSEDLEDVDAANIVKVTGSRSNVDAAIAHLKSNVKPPPSDAVTKDITVPLKYHQSISQQGNFFRTLRSFGVTVDHSAMPTKAALPSPPAPDGASEARIDDPVDAEVPSFQWQVVENYKDVDEGDSTWTLKGKDDASLAKAEKLVIQGIENAAKKTHVGYLTLADRSSFPRIVGTRGANVARLRDESGADITVGRENNVIVIIGSQAEVENAKTAILELAGSRGQGRRRND